MKLKLIEKTPAPTTKKKGYATTTQKIEDITVLNCFMDGRLCFRHCARLESGEHATWYSGEYARRYSGYMDVDQKWTANTLLTAYGFREYWEKDSVRGARRGDDKRKRFATKEEGDGEIIGVEIRRLHNDKYWTRYEYQDWVDLLDRLEREYDADKRATAAERKQHRIDEFMEQIELNGMPDKFMTWGAILSVGGMGVAVHNPDSDTWCCSECGEMNPREDFTVDPGQKLGTNKPAYCPSCGRPVRILSRRKKASMIEYSVPVMLLQEIDEGRSVMRHFRFYTYAWPDKQKELEYHETVRLVMYKGEAKQKKRYGIYYNICRASGSNYNSYYGASRGCTSWQDTNPANQRMVSGYLYPDPETIVPALKGTDYEQWTNALRAMSWVEMKANYNNLLASADERFPAIAELLCKGRFYNLLSESSDSIWAWTGGHFGRHLNLSGRNIHEVLGLNDMQMVNRLRDMNGQGRCLEWLKWSEAHHRKLPQKVLTWLTDVKISPTRTSSYIPGRKVLCIFDFMTPEQVMNYIAKQQAAGYKGMSPLTIVGQWEDYMDMADKLGKKIKDELIYKPTDLKLRHDEYTAECEKHAKAIEARRNKARAREMAKDMKKRFPASEKILKEIKPLLEWENDGYKIIVPNNLAEIIFEGNALHHCAGATDRYFDRICQHETYICFLRKKDKPKEPYYTIEVEPGGVIRQHRGMYDEEPEIEKVKPALKEWQKAIRKRMKKNDKLRAKESERKRIENIAYLREHINEKNNRFVLKGLEEDLMAL